MRRWQLGWVLLFLSGCFSWRPSGHGVSPVVELSPEPGIPLALEPVRSSLGDVLLFLPQGWFVLDLGERTPVGMVAVGVNPEYTLALTLSSLQRSAGDTLGQLGLLELARWSFARHQARTAGGIRLSGDFTILRVGPRSFAVYRFARNGRHVRVAVFVSSLGTVYELALVPLSLRVVEPPAEEECERLFRGVLRAVQF